MKNKICSFFLIGLLASASCFAEAATVPGLYQKVTTVSSTFPGEEQEVVNIEIANKAWASGQADPVHLKLNQKIGEISVYWYVENQKGYFNVYYSLDKNRVDSEFLKVTGGQWGVAQYAWFGNTSETYQFIPQKPGTTTLYYKYRGEKPVIEVPIVIDPDPVQNSPSSDSDVVSEQS
ncbi:MAG: hypothetical protein FJ390_04385 [Verrucomicrobia bacterium]|nr:hypothetical protein [Verrucomicrobiota bacterium]